MADKLMLACPHGAQMRAVAPIVHEDGNGQYWVGIVCRWPGWTDNAPHRHNLAPDPADPERVAITDTPQYFASLAEAYRALDRWREQRD